MTQPSRTTETINRDHAAIRDIMHQIRELTVPDRATLAVGLIGHLATLMNRRQMTKLMGELQEEATRVQDVPPSRQQDQDRGAGPDARADADDRATAGGGTSGNRAVRDASRDPGRRAAHEGVGQAGRGEFRARKLL